jgi:succinoglycan biosynthesis protein ExoM
MERLVSICVNTYKRVEFLDKLLDSLVNQQLPALFSLEVVIVDNDKNGSAKEKVEEWINKELLEIRYFIQPIQNISLTRNKAVSEAKGKYLLFIDDDGFASDHWIIHMVQTLHDFNADGVFGTVKPYFEEGIEEWIKNTDFFERLIQNTGEESKYFRTGNCLVKASILANVDGPFDASLGLTGGEDSDLFGKLKRMGFKFVFCKEAIVFDFVPKERANLKYLIHRFHRTGITSIAGRIKRSKIPLFNRLLYFFRSMTLIIFSSIMYSLSVPFKTKRAFWAIKLASYTGHMAAVFEKKLEGYKL